MKNTSKGFTLIELIIAIGLMAIFIPSLIFVFSFSLGTSVQGESYTQAYTIAQEQMEAIYFLKDNDISWNWTDYPENNGEIDYYQPSQIDGEWSLGLKKEGSPTITNGYAATVKIYPVIRNTSGDISEDTDDPLNTVDPTSRKIVVDVSWKEKGEPTSIELVSYATKH